MQNTPNLMNDRSIENQSELPEWEDISFITRDLTRVLDTVDDDTPIPVMRVRLARTIAQMRAEKGHQDQEKRDAILKPYEAIRQMTLEVRAKLRKARLQHC